jgi:hypothetical protein
MSNASVILRGCPLRMIAGENLFGERTVSAAREQQTTEPTQEQPRILANGTTRPLSPGPVERFPAAIQTTIALEAGERPSARLGPPFP